MKKRNIPQAKEDKQINSKGWMARFCDDLIPFFAAIEKDDQIMSKPEIVSYSVLRLSLSHAPA